MLQFKLHFVRAQVFEVISGSGISVELGHAEGNPILDQCSFIQEGLSKIEGVHVILDPRQKSYSLSPTYFQGIQCLKRNQQYFSRT